MANTRRLSSDQEVALAARYAAGATAFVLANELDVSVPTVLAAVKRQGVAIRNRGHLQVDEQTEVAITAAYLAGTTVAELARQYEVQRNTVRTVLRRQGAYTRPFVPFGRGVASPRRKRMFTEPPSWVSEIADMRDDRKAMKG